MTETDPKKTDLTLASASPRRAELMRQAGYTFEIVTPPLTEPDEMGHDVPPESQAEAWSYFKARSVAKAMETGWIIGADTIVALDGAVFGKPADVDDARRILGTLAGTRHRVITGVTLLDAGTGERLISHDVTTVTMRPLSGEALDQYLASEAWTGKAGAYGIQDKGDAFIERIDGSFTNVVGLPMDLLSTLLQKWGYPQTPDPATKPESV